MTCNTRTKKGAAASATLSGMVIASLAFGATAAVAQEAPESPETPEIEAPENLLDLEITIGFDGEEYTEDAPDFAPGDWLTLGSAGFEPNEEVVVLLGDTVIGETTADEDGVVSLRAQLPTFLLNNAYDLSIQALDSENVATTELGISDTEFWVDAEEITRGVDFGLRGGGFVAGESISISLVGDDLEEEVTAEAEADELGDFEAIFNIPTTVEEGRYVVRATGEDSERTADIGIVISGTDLEIVDPEDVDVDDEDEPDEDVEEEFGFDGLRTGSLSLVEDGETLDLEITATLEGEDVDIEFEEDDFVVATNNSDDEIDGLSVTFNGAGERILTVTHIDSAVSATRALDVLAVEDEDEDEQDDDENGSDEDENGDNGDNGDAEDGELADINVELSTNRAAPGAEVVVSADGFAAEEEVVLSMNPELGNLVADDDGQIEQEFFVPEDIVQGEYDVTLTGESGAEGSAPLTVIALPGEGEESGDFEGDLDDVEESGFVEDGGFDEEGGFDGGDFGGDFGSDRDDAEEVVVDDTDVVVDTERDFGSDRGVGADEAPFGEDDSAETAVIASGFVQENPGMAAGLAALMLGGIGAAAFGAHKLMARRTS